MPAEHTCPKCGTVLPSDALEGLCPKCVGRVAFVNAEPVNAPDDRVEAIFNAALALSDATAREAFISAACPSDVALAARLRQLLAMHEGAGKFLKAGVPASPDIEAELARLKPEEGGERIGQYKLLEEIGKGGFGTVWVAVQEKPVRRRVALKIIKMGMDTTEVIARFEQERQALALMDHPNIAKVLDAGATQWGRPFFVMELVRGIKITDYCDQEELPTAERLALFIRVCNAVQHAHQKGIIHRDLKPSNILVTINDGEAVPKVIDFGVAKATQGRLTEHTVYTQFQQMIGTPLYMSPEQAEMTSLDIDTRSDIYSLGVLLYELLTGHTPIEQETLARVGMDEIRRVIREVDPPRPSMRFKAMDQRERTTAAKRRRMDPAKLSSALCGDLDWIVMKALEKNRNRRYETANGLALDLQRHLQSEPVLARPPSIGYKSGKFIRKHRGPVAAAVAVVLALIAGLVASTVLYFDKKAAWASESAQKTRAETEANKSQQVATFLQDMLKGVGPQVALGEDTKLLRKILDDTAERVSKDLKGQPAVEAELRETLGRVYFDLGEFKRSEEMYLEALRLNDVADSARHEETTARLLIGLGHTQTAADQLDKAEITYQTALARNKSLYGEVSEGVAKSLYGLGEVALNRSDHDAAERFMREAVEQWKKVGKERCQEATLTMNDLGLVYLGLGKPSEAEARFGESLALRTIPNGEDTPEVAESLNNIGLTQWYQGRLDDAETTLRKALAIKEKILPKTHLDQCATYNNLSLVLRDKGELGTAEELQRHLLDLLKQSGFGDTHRNVIMARNNLAIVLRRRGAQLQDMATLLASLKINPADLLTADAVSALHSKQSLSPILPEHQWSAAAWQYTDVQPGAGWSEPDFADTTAWKSVPAPHGSATFFPRKPNTPITSHADIWLRREFVLTEIPAGKLLLRINHNQDAQVFLNGVQAAPTSDWSDTDVFVACTESLKRGRNVLALRCNDADGNAPIDVRIFATPDLSLGRKRLVEEFDRMIAEESPQAELYAGRASARARLGRWTDALKDLTTAMGLKSSNAGYYYQLAPLLLQAGSQTGYQSHRRAALEQFINEDRPDVATQVARLVLLSPAQESDLKAAVKLAGIGALAKMLPGLSWRQATEGLAKYRDGHPEEAIDWMNKALATGAQKDLPGWNHEREKSLAATAYLVQAMAYRNLKNTKGARATLDRAIEVIQGQWPKEESGDLGREWADWLFASILRREAEALIGGK